jgi:hypothetical protein
MKKLILIVLVMDCLVFAASNNDFVFDGKTQDHRLKYGLIGGAVGLVSGGGLGTAVGFIVASGDWWPMEVLACAVLGSAVGLPTGIIVGYQKGKPKQVSAFQYGDCYLTVDCKVKNGANPGIGNGLWLMPTVTYKF